ELPTDRPRPTVQGEAGGRRPFRVPATTAAALTALSRREGATLFMTLLAAWQLLLAKYSGQDDVTVGTPIAGRTRLETEGLIGFFVNTLVLRADIGSAPSFRALLGRVREATLGAYQHQDIPFEKLVEELKVERSLSHTPLFQVMFSLQNNAREALRLGTLQAEALGASTEAAKFDLDLGLSETGDTIAGSLAYRTELFDASTVDRMLEHFGALLATVAADPDQALSDVSLLGADERRRVVEEWSAASFVDAEADARPVHVAFAAQAMRTPDAVALAFVGGTLTYAELDARANQLANHLRRKGVGPDTNVGVCLERSPALVVALLGVLKAGGAYVPLDPSYPADRLAWMLTDAGAPLLLTEQRLLDRLPSHAGETLCLEQALEAVAAESVEAPSVAVDPEHLAYVIYTSGSTGRPKGVGVPHRALAAHMSWMQRAYPLSADDRVLQKTPFSFDASVWEFWAPLLAGATLVVGGPEAHRDPAELARAVAEERITILQLVPSLLHALLDAGTLAGARSLRRLFCGGEALPAELAARAIDLLETDGGLEVINLYGPTEVCIDSVVHSFAGTEAGATVPIGRPVDQVRAYVLDGSGQPVPVGVAGELCLGGAQLARGYLGRAALTAEAFVPDPFGTDAGARLYRTGDRARWLADGTLEYLGRVDTQLKVRGFRVEPGEIEGVLAEHPSVRRAVVVVREGRLVAYVVTDAATSISSDLRDHLRGRLPAHMVPAAVVVLDALPVTPSGKVDRRALPAPMAGAGDEGRRLKPGTELEARIAALWQDLLGVEEVGAEDNFFDLGGHSLLLIRMQARLSQEMGREVPVVELFQRPTVRSLAALLQGNAETGAVEEGEERGGTRQAALSRRLEARRRRDG
ncbi:MAG TPA: amino acid adenylation domain-containing protein, partial [Longimicrobium sp.]|nr:amino acid adenylation domain-containing protein [Longimicrobium sp.]